MTSPKGQQEIIGLIIIVIIITFAMMIYLANSVADAREDEGADEKREYRYNEQAVSFIKTFLDLDVCEDKKIRDLLIDCGTVQRISCNGRSSCAEVERVSQVLTTRTFDDWRMDYLFNITYSSVEGQPVWYAIGSANRDDNNHSSTSQRVLSEYYVDDVLVDVAPLVDAGEPIPPEYTCTPFTTGRAPPGVFRVPYFPYQGNVQLELGICG